MKPMVGITKIIAKAGKNLMKCKPVAKAMVKINKNKPEILAVGGSICIVAAFGWAIYEAVTVKDALSETSEKVQNITQSRDEALASEDISEEQKNDIIETSKKDLNKARMEGVLTVGKKFVGPAVVLVTGMKLGRDGFKVLKARNLLLCGALKSKEDILRFYRENVRNDLGKEADLKYMRGVVGEQQIEETKVDENGKETKVLTTIPVVKPSENPWKFQFDEENFDSWQEDTDLNLFYLNCEQDWWNHNYQRTELVTMYEILKHMRFRFDKAKERMGKKKFKEFMDFIRNNGWWAGSNGDGFIDFGIYRAANEGAIRRMSDVIFVEFNCDGCMLNM